MSRRTLFLVVLIGLAAFPARADEPPASDTQDLVFFNDASPLFLRLHIEVDGKPYQTYWTETITKLHKFLDTDGDGVLSAKERGNWLQRMANVPAPAPRAGATTKMAPAQQPTAGRSIETVATADDLVSYLRPGFGPFQLQITPRNQEGPETLFSQLDSDGDKKLTESELRTAEVTLMKFDQDDDETIRAEELLPYQSPFNQQRRRVLARQNAQAAGDNTPFAAMGAGESRTKLVRRLLTQYDKHGGPDDGPGKDNKLQRDEIGFDPDAFAATDNDGDGGLDSDELVHALATIPPALELHVEVGRDPGHRASIAVVNPEKKPSPLASKVRRASDTELGLALETVLVELNAKPGGAGGGLNVRDFYTQQFRAADADNNKYLEKKETERNGLFNAQQFQLMDRDGDGKLFEEEMLAFVGQQADAAESRTMLSVSDQGRSLFEVLDLNRDRRLSVRELRGAIKKVASWDRNGDGAIDNEEIPRHFQLNFGRGQSPLLINVDVFAFKLNPTNSDGPSVGPGPEWFRKMDRNLDGDLSPREFLGTRDQFRRLDTDGDGLIDMGEAAKAR
jgi:Ca2+-binding EF-hand superfamily protein